jgi:hypothetical protein
VPKSNPVARTKVRNKGQIVVALKSAARKLGHPPTTIELHLLAGIHRSQVAYRSMAIARQYAPRDWDRKTIWSKNPSRSPPTRWGKRARSGFLKEILFPELLFLRLRSTLSFCRS